MGLKQNIAELFQLGEIKDTLVGLIEAKISLKKIEIQEKVEYGVGKLIYILIQAFLGMLSFTLALVLAAYFLNIWLGAPWGYVIVLSLSLLSLALFSLKKEEIKEAIRDRVVKEVDAVDE